jgi:DNA polymerase III delta' subunit
VLIRVPLFCSHADPRSSAFGCRFFEVTKFSDILDHEEPIAWLRDAWRSGRLPHGLVFAGPVGVGKATTARALATLFLCEAPRKDEPCGACASCRAMAADVHPDYHVVYRQLVRLEKGESKARDLSIDVVRQHLVAPANLKANRGHGKVFVVEEADLMNANAQNALLKTLEEPAARTLIILLTDQPNCLLPTIRSRTQLVRFGLLDEKLVQRELAKRGVDKGDAADAALFTEGSLGVALVWLGDGVVERGRQLADQLDAVMAGKASGELQDWLKKSAEAFAEKALAHDKLASKDQATREGLATYLRVASNHFRRRLGELDSGEEIERACAAIDAVVAAEQYLDANVNVPLVIQQFVSKLEMLFSLAPSPAGRGVG